MFIKKFKLKSKFSEETEFETTKTRKTTIIMSAKTITDDEGNLLSPSGVFPPSVVQTITEEVTAVSLPSRTPANVEIIEIIDNGEKSSDSESNVSEIPENKVNGPKIMEGPTRKKPMTLDKLQGDRGVATPVVINSDPETTMWVN